MLLHQYPAWLEQKKGVLPEEEWQQRNEQYSILCRVCQLYEQQKTPQDNLSEIVLLIEKMGETPKELIEESVSATTTQEGGGASANPMPEMPPDCCLM